MTTICLELVCDENEALQYRISIQAVSGRAASVYTLYRVFVLRAGSVAAGCHPVDRCIQHLCVGSESVYAAVGVRADSIGDGASVAKNQ